MVHLCVCEHTQGAALLYNNFMKDFLAKSNANPIPAEGKVEVRHGMRHDMRHYVSEILSTSCRSLGRIHMYA